MGREPTRLYKGTYEDAGRLLISEAERSLGDSPQTQEALAHTREVFRDLTATTVLIVGKNTGRVYSLVYASNGPKMTRKDEIVVDQFDQPVDIQPPPDVAAPTGDQSASRFPETIHSRRCRTSFSPDMCRPLRSRRSRGCATPQSQAFSPSRAATSLRAVWTRRCFARGAAAGPGSGRRCRFPRLDRAS